MAKRAEPETPSAERQEQQVEARAFWSGVITFGLVSIPVELFAAVRRARFPLHMLSPDGEALRRVYVCSVEGKRLTDDEIVRGFERAKGDYVTVTDDELEAIAPERSRDIDLSRFVDRREIPPLYFERAYFLAPAGESAKAYHLLTQTMERTGRAGIATFVMRGKEYLVAIIAEGGVLYAETLRFSGELRSLDAFGLPPPAKVAADALEHLRESIRAHAAPDLDPAELIDDGERRLAELVERKRARHEDLLQTGAGGPEEAEGGGGEPVVDLMALLRERVGKGRSAHGPNGAKARGAAEVTSRRPPLSAARRAPARAAARSAGPKASVSAKRLATLSKKDLLERASALGIGGRRQMSREALIAAIRRSLS